MITRGNRSSPPLPLLLQAQNYGKWMALIATLRSGNYLPAVIFTFSKARVRARQAGRRADTRP